MDDRNLPNLPLRFDRLGGFLYGLKALEEKRAKMTAAEFLAEFDKLMERHSESPFDIAIGDFDTIVNTIYNAGARGCPHGSTVVRG